MSYDVNTFVKLGELKTLTQRVGAEISAVASIAADAIKAVAVSGSTVKFFKTTETTGTPAYTFDFPAEMLLDQAKTTFVPNFAFSAETYPGATNPSLDGKPVLVLAVKTSTGDTLTTINYSFLDMETLVDVYTVKAGDSAKILTIADNEIEVHISAAANNAITVQSDGLHVDISGKADKVANATAGHFATLTADGNIADSGVKVATAAEVAEMLDEVFGPSGD